MNDIQFHHIVNSSDKYFDKMYELYRKAFPPAERRNLGGLEHVLNYEKRFRLDAVLKNEQFVGFFSYWDFGKFLYAEHFAIDERLRGQNVGSAVMERFLSISNLPIVFEVEMPTEPNAIRRIKFYEKMGCKVVPHSYAQPYYDGSGKLLPMLVMTNDLHFADKHFKSVKKTIYSEVYNYTTEEE